MRKRWLKWLIGVLVVVLALAYAIAFLIDEPLRRFTERQMNARLKGYTARIGSLDYHPVNFSVDFRDVVLAQDAHPDPPVFRVAQLTAGVQWSALVHGRVVADFTFDDPVVYVDRTHFVRELEDPTPVKERGWQEALQAMYPLRINSLTVRRGAATYVDSGQVRPLTVSAINLVARDIRNVKSEPTVYPSPVRAEATVFDEGRLRIEGHADFLRVPHAAVKGDVVVERIALDYFGPIAARYGFTLASGTVGGSGHVEYAPEVKVVELDELRVDGLKGDYAYRKRQAAPVTKAVTKTAEAAQEVSNKPDVLLKARRLSVNDATVGFVNEETTPRYRVVLANTTLVMDNFSNQRTEGTATAQLDGHFMGSGATTARATFRPEINGPDFDLNVRIENTDLKAMNDLLRAHAKVDVVSGVFSMYAEVAVKNGRVEGYVKPLFRDLDVYDRAQDEDKSFGRKLKEKAADLVGKVLRNRPREEVATVVPISGPVGDAKASTWETLVRLIQNGFFKAILPGFERDRSHATRQSR